MRPKPSARITATSVTRSRTIIAIELAAIRSTVIGTTRHRLYMMVLISPIPVTTLASAADSSVVSVSAGRHDRQGATVGVVQARA
jgi:hypothetical protein